MAGFDMIKVKPENSSVVIQVHDWSTKPQESELSEDLEWEDPDFLNGKCTFKFKFEEDTPVSEVACNQND